MTTESNKAYIHFIDMDTDVIVSKQITSHIPRAGDECRFKLDEYFTVKAVVHVYDEATPFARVNIGVRKVK